MLDVSVVVPVRNGAAWLDSCLAAIVAARPCEIIVVDGNSTDGTLAIARRYPVRLLSDEGRGVAVARALGVQAATCSLVALIDVDVVLPEGGLARLVDELHGGGYTALQAGLHSVSGGGYWGRALVQHHRTGWSKNWFGVGATIFHRAWLVQHQFDPLFLSGEDIDLRWRLLRAGARLGVSRTTIAQHWFGDSFAFARGQWLADGRGLGAMIAKYGWSGVRLFFLPLAAALRGGALSVLRLQPIWLLYYACYFLYNYVGMLGQIRRAAATRVSRGGRPGRESLRTLVREYRFLRQASRDRDTADPAGARAAPAGLPMLLNSAGLIVGTVSNLGFGFLSWLLAARTFPAAEYGLASGIVSAMMLCVLIATLGIDSAVITLFPQHQAHPARLLKTAIGLVAGATLATAGAFLLLTRIVFANLGVIAETPAYLGLFLLLSVLGAINTLLDQISVAFRRGDQVPVRSVVAGLLRLALVGLLPLAAGANFVVIIVAWVVGNLGACLLGAAQLWRVLVPGGATPAGEPPFARRLLRVGLPNYLLTLADRAPALILPIVATEIISPVANAYWYTVWMMALIVFIVPTAFGTSLFAEAARHPDALRAGIRRALRTSAVLGGLGAVVLGGVAPALLAILGPDYAAAGVTPLRILVATVLPLTLTQVYFAVCRGTRRLSEAVATAVLYGIAAVGLAALLGNMAGLRGMALGWLGAQAVAGVWVGWRLWSLYAGAAIGVPGEGRHHDGPAPQAADAVLAPTGHGPLAPPLAAQPGQVAIRSWSEDPAQARVQP
jgi:O-antigen/teichoic acid export membrane protein/glycosyltransferase involved in cell wall biosynthesis